jgi:hypothetical protein
MSREDREWLSERIIKFAQEEADALKGRKSSSFGRLPGA